eukprot:296253-Karenia_brevis.AAC.1
MDRLARDEIASTLGESVAVVLWDIQKFFDSIDLMVLADAALELGFHPGLLGLVLQLYMGIRTLRVKLGAGDWIIPTRSITAGCGHACYMVKAFFHPILKRGSSIGWLVRSSQYIDDVTQSGRGARSDVEQQVAAVAAAFHDDIHAAGLMHNGKKAVVTASDKKLAQGVADELQRLTGCKLQVVKQARDLGVDCAAARRRPTKVASGRVSKAKARVGLAKR